MEFCVNLNYSFGGPADSKKFVAIISLVSYSLQKLPADCDKRTLEKVPDDITNVRQLGLS